MRSPARLVTGTAAAVTVVALGLTAAPSASAGDIGRLEITPATASPGTEVTVSTTVCAPKNTGAGDAGDLGAGAFELRPGTHKEEAVGHFTVPWKTGPGTYTIGVSCDNGKEAAGDLEVTAGSSGWPKPEPELPSGHVKTGAGGSVRPDTAQIAAGAGVLAAAGVAGIWLLRRRTNGTQGG